MVLPPSSGQESDLGRVRRLAELLWERVERVRERAEDEARSLAKRVDAYGDALGRPLCGEAQRLDTAEARKASAGADFERRKSVSSRRAKPR